MDSSNVLQLLEQLDDEIDDLEESLAPLLKTALSDSVSKLPLLDKAKLYVLVTYAIESIIFAYLRLNGVKAREHPVFKELTRVKQYFDKIKVVETPVAERTMAVDKGAAARFIKAGLAGNDKYDQEHAEKQTKERARAHIKFEELTGDAKKRKVEEPKQSPKDASSSLVESDTSSDEDDDVPAVPKKKQKVSKNSVPSSGASTPLKGKTSSEQEEGMSQKKKSKSPKGTGKKRAKQGKRKSKSEA